ncbi:MAG: amidohydrolase [Candidatus Cloacimonetes bacterium]|nr:amidohydrolase [Candidatus Cloacimonadota bacterium]
MLERMIELRHYLHSNPDLPGEEEATAAFINDILGKTEPDELWTGVGGKGIVALYRGAKSGKVIGIRADMDGLPIVENTNLPYKSKKQGVSHSCGHDGHMAIILGIAEHLAQNRNELTGTIVLIFQPEEELGTGAAKMLADKRMQDLKFDTVLALHNLPGFKNNALIVRKGAFTSNTTGMIIRLWGATSHAGHPEDGNSPVMAMTAIINSLNTIPQMYIPVQNSALITIIHARLGDRAFGTTPGYAHIMATMRAYEAEDLETMKSRAVFITEGIAESYDLRCEIEWVEDYPAMINDDKLTDELIAIGKRLDLPIIERAHPFSWSEDFSRFAERSPGLLIGLGSGKDLPQLHNSNYDFPDDLLETGYNIFVEFIYRLNR